LTGFALALLLKPPPYADSICTSEQQMHKCLGHSKLETTQLYAESSTAMMRESLQRALSR
jgi:hypothetical protein